MFLLPIFLGFVWLGRNTPVRLFDTHIGMILVYTAFFTPVAIFLMRAYFQAIPREPRRRRSSTAASFGAFWRVVLPNAAPACSRRSSTRSCSPGTSCCSSRT